MILRFLCNFSTPVEAHEHIFAPLDRLLVRPGPGNASGLVVLGIVDHSLDAMVCDPGAADEAKNSNPPWAEFSTYREYLEGCLCWLDGTPTHLSRAPQRQCPKCRVKWSYIHKQARFKAMMEFCAGSNAAQIGRSTGCAKNTARAYFQDFSRKMEEIVAELIISGGIATRPTCARQMCALERALHWGQRKRRTKVCRHLFLHGLDFEERTEALFQKSLLPDIREHVNLLKTRESSIVVGPRYAAPRPNGSPSGSSQPAPPPQKPFFVIVLDCGRWIFKKSQEAIKKLIAVPSPACKRQGALWVRAWVALRPPGSPEIHVNYDAIRSHDWFYRYISIPSDDRPIHPKEEEEARRLKVSAERLRELIPCFFGNFRGFRHPRPASFVTMGVVASSFVSVSVFGDRLRNAPEFSSPALYKLFADQYGLPQLTPEQEAEMRKEEEEWFEIEMRTRWSKRPPRIWEKLCSLLWNRRMED